VDVLVLGAGVIGASVAHALAARGASVTILEMRSPGRGASQAAAGILAPFIEAHGDPRLLELCVRGLDLFDAFIARLNGEDSAGVEYHRTGTLEVATDAGHCETLRSMESWLLRLGIECGWHDAAALHAFEPALTANASGGLYIPRHGFVSAAPLVAALMRRARFLGAVLVCPVEAAHIDAGQDRVTVRTDIGTYTADAGVIATGSWSKRVRIANLAALPMRPVRGQLLHLRSRGSTPPGRVIWGPDCYVVPWADGSMLVGATMEEAGFDESTTVAGVEALLSGVAALLPGSATASLEGVRVGLRPALPDGLPAIGPFSAAPHVVAATGHFRNGVLLSALTADVVERYLIDGVRDEIFAFTTPDRFLV
jgi:glycine oxidase